MNNPKKRGSHSSNPPDKAEKRPQAKEGQGVRSQGWRQRPPASPRPVREFPAEKCRTLTWFLTDIDDTLTRDGMLPSLSYVALWDLARAGIKVVPVTGRPAGWCDHIARMWPVAGVVGENGAFSYSYDREKKRMKRTYSLPLRELAEGREKLARIARKVLRKVPGSGIAADQPFRVSDYAIDFREDVPSLSDERVSEICRILAEEKVRFKVSSIHVNFWLGDFDKLSRLKIFIEEEAGMSFEALQDTIVFIGDSLNDEPLFQGIATTIGVGNLKKFLSRLSHLPGYMTEGESAEGFREASNVILAKRGSRAPLTGPA
jgi:hypothetical protein